MNTLLLACCASALTGAAVRQVPPLLEYTFATNEQGWTVFQPQGDKAKVGLIHDPAHVKVGTASLKYTYQVTSGELSVAMVPIADGAIAKMKSLSFWVLSDHASGLAVTISEKGGGHYNGIIYAPKDRWQEVNMSLNDFTLATGPSDPKDDNGKLDPEKIESISLIDFDQFLFQTPAIATALHIAEGTRNIYLSGVKITEKVLSDAITTTGNATKVDSYDRPQVGWMGLGVGNLSVAQAGPLNELSLKADYHVGMGQICGVIRPVPAKTLAGAKTISLHWASAKSGTFILQFEEDGGAKYNRTLQSEGGSKAIDNTIALSSFTHSEDSKDDNNQLDPEKVHQVALIDASGVAGTTDQDNILWIGSVVIKR